jgi:hypothetical protein
MDQVKVFFALEQDDDGWPGVGAESVWAFSTDDPDEYVIDNVPFYTFDAMVEDTVRVTRDADGVRWFAQVVREAERSLLRVIVMDASHGGATRAALEALGCATEGANEKFFALDVPFSVDLGSIHAWLDERLAQGVLEYEDAILRHPAA